MPQKEEQKSRTPSGNIIQYQVKNIRTFFSPEKDFINESEENFKGETNSVQSSVKSVSTCQGVKKGVTSVTSQSYEDQNKQLDNTSDSEDESVYYATPPVTPARSKGILNRVQAAKLIKEDFKSSSDINMASLDPATVNQPDSNTESTPKQVVKQITEELQQMMDVTTDDEPQTMSVATVHAMFKRLQVSIEQCSVFNASQHINTDTEQISKKIADLETQNKAVKGAVHHMWDRHSELAARMQKAEVNNYRKMVVLTGLYTSRDKELARLEIKFFLDTEIGVRCEIEDYFEIGSATPKAKVITFRSIRDKEQVMNQKHYLKNSRNDDGKKYYINDYFSPEQNERRRVQREMMKYNKLQDEENQVDINYDQGQFVVEGTPFYGAIDAPAAHEMMDLSTAELEKVLKLPICKGPEVAADGNRFIGYTYAVQNIQQIKSAYLKMRICNPKARHIICAFNLPCEKKQEYLMKGYCDDGEHSAGAKLLEAMVGSDMENRVVFIVRYYSGKKLGGSRFDYIFQAMEKCLELYPYNDVLKVSQELKYDVEISPPQSLQGDENTQEKHLQTTAKDAPQDPTPAEAQQMLNKKAQHHRKSQEQFQRQSRSDRGYGRGNSHTYAASVQQKRRQPSYEDETYNTGQYKRQSFFEQRLYHRNGTPVKSGGLYHRFRKRGMLY